MTTEKRWYASVDWASENHHVRITDSDGRTMAEKIFKHGGEGLNLMADWLMTMSGAESPNQIHIAIEVPHGPVVETLLERGFQVYAINPKQLDRFRDRYSLEPIKLPITCSRSSKICYKITINAVKYIYFVLSLVCNIDVTITINIYGKRVFKLKISIFIYFPLLLA